MKLLSAVPLLLLVASVLPAVAGTVNLQFNNNGPYSYGYPAYPYYFTVNGTTSESLMCIGYNEHITYGESLQANEMTVAAYGALIGSPLKAEDLAYLYTLALADVGANSAINAGAWFLNEGQPSPEADGALLAGFTPDAYSSVRVYVPTSNQTGWTISARTFWVQAQFERRDAWFWRPRPRRSAPQDQSVADWVLQSRGNAPRLSSARSPRLVLAVGVAQSVARTVCLARR